MACTFDSPCLTSAVHGVQPSFGFNPHNTNYFGISASFTRGTKKCYETASPTWQPVIESGGFSATCTWIGAVQSIYCPNLPVTDFAAGKHTLTYSVERGSPAPFVPTTFVIAKPHSTAPDQPIVATDYITITRPSSTHTKTYTSTYNTGKGADVIKGTETKYGPPITHTEYTYEHAKPRPTYTTITEHKKMFETDTIIVTKTAPCKPEQPKWGNEGGWNNWGQKPKESKKPENDYQNGNGEHEESEQKPDYTNGKGELWSDNRRVPAAAALQMNTEMKEEIGPDGNKVRVAYPCKGACGGWSGPDYTLTGGPPKPTNSPKETITWTKTTTKYYGVKTVPTTTTSWKVHFTMKNVPETTTTFHKHVVVTTTLPPKSTPYVTKTETAYITYIQKTTTKITKTVPCRVKTVTSLETKTHVETVTPSWGNNQWGGGWAARATKTVSVEVERQPLDLADGVDESKAETKVENVPSLTAGAKFRF